MFEEIRQKAISVTSNIFETMFFIFLEPSGEDRDEDSPIQRPSDTLIRSEIGFQGRYSGRVKLSLPYELAQSMAANFLGLEEEAPESQTMDMVGEVSNMICGNLFSALDSKTIYQLTLPTTAKGTRQEMEEADRASDIRIDLSAEGQPVTLRIELEPKEGNPGQG